MDTLAPSTLEAPGTVIIDDRDPERPSRRTLAFSDPVDVLIARSAEEVNDTLTRIDALLASGKHLAGYLAYDAGLVLDKPIQSRHAPTGPLIWLGVYDRCRELDTCELEHGSAADISDGCLNVTEDEYIRCIDRIRDYIAAGDVYQVNYTVKLRFEHAQPAWRLFARLRQAHPVGYSAYINTGDAQIVSLSPELFLRRDGDHVLTRPMKGTARRGRWFSEDMEIIDELEHESRGVYCGCIGYLRPSGDCLLNVAIRTIVQRSNQCEMGLGSGIVADAAPRMRPVAGYLASPNSIRGQGCRAGYHPR